jgi:uncharacterized phage protein gp47/JayE
MGFTVKTFDQILGDMILWIASHSPQISDMNPGSVIRSFCEASANSIEEVYVAVYLGFRRELEFLKERAFDFARKTGTKASGSVVFSRTSSSGDVTIPTGTKLKTNSGLRFVTQEDGLIANGFTSSSAVDVIAEDVGKAYNVASSTVVIIEEDISGVDSVTNSNPMVNGVDVESDYAYHSRFQAYMEGLGKANIAGLVAGALSVDQITAASVVEHFPPIANVNAHLYVDDGSTGGVSTDKLAEVQLVIDGDGSAEYPGYRAAGVNVVVAKPTAVVQNVTLTVYAITSGVDTSKMASDVQTAITDYINGLGIGDDIIHAELIQRVMEVFGVFDCSISTPAANVSIAGNQVARAGTITVTVG